MKPPQSLALANQSHSRRWPEPAGSLSHCSPGFRHAADDSWIINIWVRTQGPKHWWVDPPTDDEIKATVATLAKRVIWFLRKKGYFQDDIDQAVQDDEPAQAELLPELQVTSVYSKIALGPGRGQILRQHKPLALLGPWLRGEACSPRPSCKDPYRDRVQAGWRGGSQAAAYAPADPDAKPKSKRWSWAKLLTRAVLIDTRSHVLT